MIETDISTVDFHKIRLFVLDVDGVLTDGTFTLMPDGHEVKSFHSSDGAGLKYWMRTSGLVALISGRKSEVVTMRANELGIETVRQGCKFKAPVLKEVLEELGVSPGETLVMGDDLPDLPMFHICGFSACPSDAVEDVRLAADYVCRTPGGRGCVREMVEIILRSTGKWDDIMVRYQPESEGSQ